MATRSTSKIQTIRYAFSGGLQGRSYNSVKDQRFVNVFPEKVGDRMLLVKRPGLSYYFDTDEFIGRGIFAYNNHIWSVVGDGVYRDNTRVLTLATDSGTIGYTDCTNSGIPSLFFCDGTNGYLIDPTNTITKITDADFPSPHIPTPAYINGYVCIPRAASADIYNCDLENPLSWTASNFITSELFPDVVVGLARQNNQVVAFGENGTEFFYDNGANQPTGTPLARTQSAFLQIGTCAPFAIGQNERFCFFIAQSQSGGRAVWKLDGFTPTKISDDAIGRILDNEEQAIVDATGYLVRMVGHFFMVFHLSLRTIVYDIDLNVWHEWNSTEPVGITDSQADGAPTNYNDVNGNPTTIGALPAYNFLPWNWPYAADIGDGTVYMLHAYNGRIAYSDKKKYKDIDQFIRCEINTPILDFGSYKRKMFHRFSFICDSIPGTLIVRWTDNDYTSWSKIKFMSLLTRPVLHRLGTARRRAFNFYFYDDVPFRCEGLEFIIEEGET